MKKLILFSLLCVCLLAEVEKPKKCEGFMDGNTCFIKSQSYSCETYTEPDKCGTCRTPLFSMNEAGTSCELDDSYPQWTALNGYDLNHSWFKIANEQIYDWIDAVEDDLAIQKASCIANGQIVIVKCEDGYFLAEDNVTCTACIAGCKTCTSAATADCTACYAGYFQKEDKSCVQCDGDKALTCASETTVKTCNAYNTATDKGLYLDKETGKCLDCPAFALCSAADTITSCYYTHFLKETTTTDADNNETVTKSCEACSSNNNYVLQCTKLAAAGTSDGVDECFLPDDNGANYYYYLSGTTNSGCIQHAQSNNCKSIEWYGDGSKHVCKSCWNADYVISQGKCVECTDFGTGSDLDLEDNYGVESCTKATAYQTDKPTVTCKKGYYLGEHSLGTEGYCNKCPEPMSECSVEETAANSGTYEVKGTEWEAKCTDGKRRKTISAGTGDNFDLTSTPVRECVEASEDSANAANCKEYIKNDDDEIMCTECDDTYTLLLAYDTKSGSEDFADTDRDKTGDRCVLHTSTADHKNCSQAKKQSTSYTCDSCFDEKVLKKMSSVDSSFDDKGQYYCMDRLTDGDLYLGWNGCAEYEITTDKSVYECVSCLDTHLKVTDTNTSVVSCVEKSIVGTNCLINTVTDGVYKCAATTLAHCVQGKALKTKTGSNSPTNDVITCEEPFENCLIYTEAVDPSTTKTCGATTLAHCVSGKALKTKTGDNSPTNDVLTCEEPYLNCLKYTEAVAPATTKTCTATGSSECADGYPALKTKTGDNSPTNDVLSCDVAYNNCLKYTEAVDPSTTKTCTATTLAHCVSGKALKTKTGDNSPTNDVLTCDEPYDNCLIYTEAVAPSTTKTCGATTLAQCVSGKALKTKTGDNSPTNDVLTCDEPYENCLLYTEAVAPSTTKTCTATDVDDCVEGKSFSSKANDTDPMCVTKVSGCKTLVHTDGTDHKCKIDSACHDSTPYKKFIMTEDTTGTFTTKESQTCIAAITDSSTAGYQCSEIYENSVTAAAETKCGDCVDGYVWRKQYGDDLADEKQNLWTCVDPLSGDGVYKEQAFCAEYQQDTDGDINCESCYGNNYSASDNGKGRCRKPAVPNCKTASAADTCTECEDNYELNGKVCMNCTNYYANCADTTYVADTGGNCQCSVCNAGYYLEDGKCKNDDLPNCAMIDPETTGEKKCFACNLGYKPDGEGVCAQCVADTFPCATTGCSSLDYPGKPKSSSSSGSSSSILMFIVSALLTLFTVMI